MSESWVAVVGETYPAIVRQVGEDDFRVAIYRDEQDVLEALRLILREAVFPGTAATLVEATVVGPGKVQARFFNGERFVEHLLELENKSGRIGVVDSIW
jgi:hypothetical protein